ncbi:MAG: ABC transporter permease subunit [Chloroflexi bacterium]|nr:ABC transporter permease subunit [Chloroflexota bacterium]
MNANIYRHELHIRWKSVFTWSVALVFLIVFFFSIFPAFAKDADLLNQMLTKFPPEMKTAFGLDNMDMATVLGFFSLIFLFVQLCLAIQAGNYGFGLVSVEEAELTADFLLTRPVSRWQILTSKLLAVLTSMLVTDLAVWVSALAAITLFRDGRAYEFSTLLLLLVSILPFQLFFLCVGLVISLGVKRIRSVTPYSLGFGFGAYVLSAFSGVFGEAWLELITPFKHFDAAAIVSNQSFDTPLAVLNVAVSLVAVAASYWLYKRRDIHAVS